jgi:hypothetical protein
VVEPFGERGGKGAGLGFAHVGQVEDGGDAVVDDEVGQQLAGGRLQGQVAVVAAEDVERQPGAGTVGAGADPPPVALDVEDHHGQAGGVHLLDEAVGD